MRTRDGWLLTLAIVGISVVLDCRSAYAAAIGLSQITASAVGIAAADGSIVATPFTVTAFAQAQNNLGESAEQFVGPSLVSATASEGVAWASASASGNGAEWSAASDANLPGSVVGAARSKGEATWLAQFTVTCDTPPCADATEVVFTAALSGWLTTITDSSGMLAQTDTTFNLLLDGHTLLFRHDLLSIGPADAAFSSFATTLTTSRSLSYDTPYTVLLRVDSESEVVNVSEPATGILLALALGFARGLGRARSATKRARTESQSLRQGPDE